MLEWLKQLTKEVYAYCQSISETELLTVASQAIVTALLQYCDLNGRFVACHGGWQGGLPAC